MTQDLSTLTLFWNPGDGRGCGRGESDNSSWDWGKIGIKLGTKTFIYQMFAFFSVEKRHLC